MKETLPVAIDQEDIAGDTNPNDAQMHCNFSSGGTCTKAVITEDRLRNIETDLQDIKSMLRQILDTYPITTIHQILPDSQSDLATMCILHGPKYLTQYNKDRRKRRKREK